MRHRSWHGTRAYSETNFHDTLLALAVARAWPDTLSNAVEPGWVPTRMGGPGATGNLAAGAATQAWLAVGGDAGARMTGGCFHHRRPARLLPATRRTDVQDRLMAYCAQASGIGLPGRLDAGPPSTRNRHGL